MKDFPARLWVRNDEVTIEGYENIYWNGREAACKGKINNGDELSFSRGKIIFLEKSVQVECEDTVNINTDGIIGTGRKRNSLEDIRSINVLLESLKEYRIWKLV